MNHTPASLAQRQANAAACVEKKRKATKCQRGHINWGFRKDGRRYCITCKVERNREWRKHAKKYKPMVTKRSGISVIVYRLTFEERQTLRQKVSDIQLAREHHTRRMHVTTLYGTKLCLAGESRPIEQQMRSGYAA